MPRLFLTFAALAATGLLLACGAGGTAPQAKPVPFNEAETPKEAGVKQGDKEKSKPEKEKPSDLTKVGLRSGDVGVSLVSTSIGKVAVQDFGKGLSKEEHFQVVVKITNHHKTKRLDYRGWAESFSFNKANARLTDEHGNSYKLIHFGIGSRIDGQVHQTATIDPGSSITDRLVFEKPLDISEELTISLPLGAIQGQSGEVRGLLPRDFSR
jgi:hypothetical protein